MDQIDKIIAYESGELDEGEMLELFQELVDSGLVWKLQGNYVSTANLLIKNGYISG
jgi:hypothetical protein